MTDEQLQWWKTLEKLENQFYSGSSENDIDTNVRAEIESADLSKLDSIWKDLYNAEKTYTPPKITIKPLNLGVTGLSASATACGLSASGFSFAFRGGYISITPFTGLASGANVKMKAGKAALGAIFNAVTGGLFGAVSVMATRICAWRQISRATSARTEAIELRNKALDVQ